ncbi:MAG: archease [Oligoflexia bacterium]|nr:archease [Oligoflexia bacterium]
MNYKLLDHTADVRLHVSANSLPGLFVECARGMTDYLFSHDHYNCCN